MDDRCVSCGKIVPEGTQVCPNCRDQIQQNTWVSVKDRLPSKNGEYLVVYHYFMYRKIAIFRFAKDLHSIDEYDFEGEHRPGWYDLDSETGYFERDGVTYWAELPKMPQEEGFA